MLRIDQGANEADDSTTELFEAVLSNSPMKVRLLLAAGVNPRTPHPIEGEVLTFACRQANVSIAIINLLLKKIGDPNQIAGDTLPIIEAIRHQRLDIVELLIRQGANVNARSRDGVSPLHQACGMGNFAIVRTLVNNKAIIDERDDLGYTPFLSVVEAIGRLTTDKNCLINYLGGKLIIDFLIAKGANIHATDTFGRNAIFIAIDNVYLLRYLASLGIDINIAAKSNLTPLELARCNDNISAFQILLEFGADVNKPTCQGKSVFMRALWRGDLERNFEFLNLLQFHSIDTKIKAENGQTLSERMHELTQLTGDKTHDRLARKLSLFMLNFKRRQHNRRMHNPVDHSTPLAFQSHQYCVAPAIKRLGSGSFSVTRVGIFKQNPVALKEIRTEKVTHTGILNEIRVLSNLRFQQQSKKPGSEYVVELVGFNIQAQPNTTVPQSITLALSLARYSLQTWIDRNNLNARMSIRFAEQLALALAFLHSMGIVHSDVKSSNVLLYGPDHQLKLTDFNSVKDLTVSPFGISRNMNCTYNFAPPELLGDAPYVYAPPVDMWSYGYTIAHTLIGNDPQFEALIERSIVPFMLEKLEEGVRPALPTSCPARLARLINACWLMNPEDRVTAEDAVSYFKPRKIA